MRYNIVSDDDLRRHIRQLELKQKERLNKLKREDLNRESTGKNLIKD